ncbi:MAG: hypothetical protein KDD25_03390, partial [Bdellovibrionales bacterium]|nr:hypothetical protein [Bdellovibrionales bacterium]
NGALIDRYVGDSHSLNYSNSITINGKVLVPYQQLKNGFVGTIPNSFQEGWYAVRQKAASTYEAFQFAPRSLNGGVYLSGIDTSPDGKLISIPNVTNKMVSVYQWPDSGPPVLKYTVSIASLTPSLIYMTSIAGDYLVVSSYIRSPRFLIFYKGNLVQDFNIKHGTWQAFPDRIAPNEGQPCWEGDLPNFNEFCDYTRPTQYTTGGPSVMELELSDGGTLKVIGSNPSNIFTFVLDTE